MVTVWLSGSIVHITSRSTSSPFCGYTVIAFYPATQANSAWIILQEQGNEYWK